MDKSWQSFWKLKFMKNQALELHSPFSKVVQSKQGERKNRVKKIEDNSCSLLLHFWSTSRSPFFTCYIPFQISGSQESNASNRVRFGAETRKIWNSEDNCSRCANGVRNSHTPLAVRMVCEWCAKLAHPPQVCENFAHPMRGANFALFLPTPL